MAGVPVTLVERLLAQRGIHEFQNREDGSVTLRWKPREPGNLETRLLEFFWSQLGYLTKPSEFLFKVARIFQTPAAAHDLQTLFKPFLTWPSVAAAPPAVLLILGEESSTCLPGIISKVKETDARKVWSVVHYPQAGFAFSPPNVFRATSEESMNWLGNDTGLCDGEVLPDFFLFWGNKKKAFAWILFPCVPGQTVREQPKPMKFCVLIIWSNCVRPTGTGSCEISLFWPKRKKWCFMDRVRFHRVPAAAVPVQDHPVQLVHRAQQA